MKLTGHSLVDGSWSAGDSGRVFHAVDPRHDRPLEPAFSPATRAEVDLAASAAVRAMASLAAPEARSRLLEAVASELEHHGDLIVARAELETALPEARLRNELARTCGQLRLFAAVVREGSWVDARIDSADPLRAPVPRPDIRSMLVPLGPVAVFGAANFPLAFSTLGGDTASAWAAGCSVVVKGHPAHPGTAELCARAALAAIETISLDPGVFSLLVDDSHEVGAALASHGDIAAVAFTGSARGGMALSRIAAARSEPIPVFAEMGSVNPVVVLEEAIVERGEAIAAGLLASCTLGTGQFCTNPGLIFLPAGDQGDLFAAALADHFRAATGGIMLTTALALAYQQGNERLRALGAVLIAEGSRGDGASSSPAFAVPRLWMVHADTLRARPALADEVFGPSAVLVRTRSEDDLVAVLDRLPGQLSATLHFAPDEAEVAQRVARVLTTRVGRLVCNGYPTGVEVGPATVHGGPFPASTDAGTTSVGTRAITRFARLVAYQDTPADLLPPDLRDDNPRGILRLVDGKPTRG